MTAQLLTGYMPTYIGATADMDALAGASLPVGARFIDQLTGAIYLGGTDGAWHQLADPTIKRAGLMGRPSLGEIGDSILGNGGNTLGPAFTGTVGSTTATCTQAGHGQFLGAKFIVSGADQAEWNGTHAVSVYSSSSAFNFELDTPSTVAAPTGSNLKTITLYRQNDRDIFSVAAAASGQRFRHLFNAACNGERSDETLGRFERDVIGNPLGRPDVLAFCTGSNDVIQSYPSAGTVVATVIANIKALMTRCLRAGIEPWPCTLPPLSAAYGGQVAAYRIKYQAINAWLRQYCYENNFLLEDLYDAWVDPASATDDYLSGYSADNQHPTPKAVQVYVQGRLTAKMQALVPARRPIAVSLADTYTTDPSNPQLNDHPLMDGTAGTKSVTPAADGTHTGTNTGSVPTGYTSLLTRSTTGSCVNSVVARADGKGSNWRGVITAVDANDAIQLALTSSIHSRVAAGDIVKLQLALSLSTFTALSRLDGWMTFTPTGGGNVFCYALTQSISTNLWTADTGELLLETKPLVVPAGGLSLLNFAARAIFSGAGGGTLEVGLVVFSKSVT